MNFNQKVLKTEKFELTTRHFLIIGILVLSFSISFLLRILPADYGWELNEFDPFFNYRATEYIIENGVENYFTWNDDLSWYPHGRDVSSNSQVILHIFTAFSYILFGGSSSLYDYAIIFPVVIGSLTSVVIFGLVRTLAGTTSGLFASLIYSISIPILIRGQVGWFKSEPLGLFLGILGTYLFLSGLQQKNYSGLVRIIFSGIILSFSLSSWGGNQFFALILGVFIIFLTFVTNKKSTIWKIPLFTISIIFVTSLFERPGINFVSSISGISLILPTIFLSFSLGISLFIKKFSKPKFFILISIIFILVLIGLFALNNSFQIIDLPTHRYLNSINPFLTSSDPLTDSVSEHQMRTISDSYLFYSFIIVFSGLGVWLLLTKNDLLKISHENLVFILIIGLSGIYLGSTYSRLEVFTSISLIILSSIGISILVKESFLVSIPRKKLFKIILIFGVLLIVFMPFFYPLKSNIFNITDNPPTILNGGTNKRVSFSDWNDTLVWIKNNTPENSVIGSWWDYGYWIQTLAERPSIADNSTVNDHIIENIAKIFFETPDNAWVSLNSLEVDYFIIFVSGERLPVDSPNGNQMYFLSGGGDESKIFWFLKIAGLPLEQYLHSDYISGKDNFWNETFLGQTIPFEPMGYADFSTQQFSTTYVDGWIGVYKNKFFDNADENRPFTLVYSSPSSNAQLGEDMIGVYVYKINKNYIPQR